MALGARSSFSVVMQETWIPLMMPGTRGRRVCMTGPSITGMRAALYLRRTFLVRTCALCSGGSLRLGVTRVTVVEIGSKRTASVERGLGIRLIRAGDDGTGMSGGGRDKIR